MEEVGTGQDGWSESLRPFASSAGDLHRIFMAYRTVLLQQVGWRLLVFLLCLIVAQVSGGALSNTAYCLSAVAGLATMWSMFAYTNCESWLHLLELHDLIRPPCVHAGVAAERPSDTNGVDGTLMGTTEPT